MLAPHHRPGIRTVLAPSSQGTAAKTHMQQLRAWQHFPVPLVRLASLLACWLAGLLACLLAVRLLSHTMCACNACVMLEQQKLRLRAEVEPGPCVITFYLAVSH
jgi:hypothetical protein